MIWPFGTSRKHPAPPILHRAETVELLAADDSAFVWLMRQRGPAPRPGLVLAPGGIETPRTLKMLRRLAGEVRDPHCSGAWLMVADGEVVGLVSFKHAPSQTGEIEIGYGVAASRRGLGYARLALKTLIERCAADGRIAALWAETAVGNAASQRTLRANGFEPQGLRYDPEHGPVRRWRRAISSSPAAVL